MNNHIIYFDEANTRFKFQSDTDNSYYEHLKIHGKINVCDYSNKNNTKTVKFDNLLFIRRRSWHDAREIVNLFNSDIQFWLTDKRFTEFSSYKYPEFFI